jgi:hypothetical protein
MKIWRRLVPSKLVVVRRYGSSVDGYPDVAHNDQKLLLENGVEVWVKYGWAPRIGGAAFLMVPRSQARAAAEVLASSPNLFPDAVSVVCPRCHNPHPAPRPAYTGMVLGVGFLLIVAATVGGYYGIAELVALVTVVGATIIQIKVPQWRCPACGRLFGTINDPDGEFGNVRNFRTRR